MTKKASKEPKPTFKRRPAQSMRPRELLDKSDKYRVGRTKPANKELNRTPGGWIPPTDLPPPVAKDRTNNIPDPETRIRYMMKLMAHGHWVTGVTGGDLADLWGMSDSVMKHDAAKASKRIKESMDETTIEELKAQALIVHQSIRDKAIRQGQLVVAERANDNYTKMAGLNAPAKHDIRTDVGQLFADLLSEPDSPPPETE